MSTSTGMSADMRRTTSTTTEKEWPSFPLGPVLEMYGGEEVMDDRGWYAYSCPFHGEDRSKSASINTVIHVFVCHTCGMKGDAITLIKKKEGKTYGDALERAKQVTSQIGSQTSPPPGGSSRGSRGAGSRTLKRTWKR